MLQLLRDSKEFFSTHDFSDIIEDPHIASIGEFKWTDILFREAIFDLVLFAESDLLFSGKFVSSVDEYGIELSEPLLLQIVLINSVNVHLEA